MSKRVGDDLRIVTSAEAANHLRQMAKFFALASSWITQNVKRTDDSVTLFNFLAASESYLQIAADNIDAHLSIMALSTRSLYEINLQVRSVLSSPENMRRWLGQAATDKIQILEGVLELDETGSSGDRKVVLLRNEIDRLKSLQTRHGLPDARPSSAGDIAKAVGLTREHRALFKLWSKLVHPSAYLVNDYQNAASHEVRMMLQIRTQMYAGDTFRRICEAVKMPTSARDAIEANLPS